MDLLTEASLPCNAKNGKRLEHYVLKFHLVFILFDFDVNKNGYKLVIVQEKIMDQI